MLVVTPRLLPALLLLFLAGTRLPSAQTPTAAPPSTDFLLKVWDTDDGLPHNSINALLQRRDGFLWVATQGGLLRFDGLRFTPVHSPLLDGVRSASVTGVIEDGADALLVATIQSGLLRWRDGTLAPHPITAEFAPTQRIAALAREDERTFWILFTERDAWRCSPERVEKFPGPSGSRITWTPRFARDHLGNVYLARGTGVERYHAGQLRTVPGTSGHQVTIGSSRRGGIWVAAGRNWLRLTGDSLEPISGPRPWPGSTPPGVILEDRAGAVWLAFNDRGLARWQDGALTDVPTSHVRISDLLEDTEGNIWAATNGGGLNRLHSVRFRLVAEEPTWTNDASGAVCEDATGAVWFANRRGIRRLNGQQFESFGPSQGWPSRALPICADATGHLWLGDRADLYCAPADGREPPVKIRTPSSSAITVLFPADDGVWVGRTGGPLMFHRANGAPQRFGSEQGYTGKTVRSIGRDAAGRIWVGTEEGALFGRTETGFASCGEQLALPGHGIRAIHGDRDGTLWLGTAGSGVLVVRDNKAAPVTERHGLPDVVISQILEDDFGWLWFGSRRGIFKVQKSDLLACAAGERAQVTPIAFGKADGISGISAIGSYQPTAWKTRGGDLWFVTRKGLVTTNPAPRPTDLRPVDAVVDRLLVDGRAVDPAPSRIQSSAKKLELEFTAPAFAAPEKVRFRHRLIGFDAEWSEPTTHRTATYTALPPGSYRFEVQASNGAMQWNAAGATLAFDVLPRWWETWWARVIAAAGAIVGLITLGRYWSHRRFQARLARFEQEQRLERERARIARDLHDDLGASLTHAGMLAEELSEDWRELPDPQARSSQLATRVRGIARDLDAVVWTVSPKNDTLASLAAYLGHFATEYFQHTSIECRVRTAENIPATPLSPESRHHLFLIAKELLNNALKHSHARTVEVTMQCAHDVFELVVRDDGRGFNLATARGNGRNGLHNLHARALEAGGALGLASSAAGTVATLRVPLVAAAQRPAATSRAS